MHLIYALGFALRIAANVVRQASRALVHAYDVLIVLPLLAEHTIHARKGGAAADAGERVDPRESTLHPLS